MKRASLVILLCLVLALLPAGCGAVPKQITVQVPAATAAGGQKEKTTKAPTAEVPTTEAPATEAPTAKLPPNISAVAAYYADYLQTYRGILDMSIYNSYYRTDDYSSYRNVAFFDVTGDGVPEMLLICRNADNMGKSMSFRIVTADANGAREITKPNGDSIMNLFWDKAATHGGSDTVLFACGSTLYFYRKSMGGEGGYSSEAEEVGRLTGEAGTDCLYWEYALEWNDSRTPTEHTVTYLAEDKVVDEATYHSVKEDLFSSADTYIIYGMEYYYPELKAYEDVCADTSAYIAMPSSEALALLESAADGSSGKAPAAETRTGLPSVAGYYADYIGANWDALDMTQYFENDYSAAIYPNVAFYDVTGDGVPEMLLICCASDGDSSTMCFRVITADRSGARELFKPNGDIIMKLFWHWEYETEVADSVLFVRNSTLYFYRSHYTYGQGGSSEEIGRLVYDKKKGNLYWDIVLEYSWSEQKTVIQAEEKDIDLATYSSRKAELLGSAEEFILYGLFMSYDECAYKELSASTDDYISMTPLQALDLLYGMK